MRTPTSTEPAPGGHLPGLFIMAFAVLTLGSGLGAYAVGPVPVQWLIFVASCAVMVLVALYGGVHRMAGGGVALALMAWLAVVSLSRLPELTWYAQRMPPLATTPYIVFLPLRYVDLLSFCAVAYFVTWLLEEGGRRQVMRALVVCGSIIAALALYIYFAQIYGLPEPTRTRVGTDGGAQAILFNYDFHRAMGTFREPSHLAEWLIVPLLVSVVYRGRWLNGHTLLMSVVMLLTGSLTGLVGLTGGLVIGALLTGIFKRQILGSMLAVGLVGIVALQIFAVLVRTYEGELSLDLLAVLADRIVPILEGGMGQSNRGFVYAYVVGEELPVWGHGLGNATIALSWIIGADAMSSHLSLYLNMLFSGGVVAALLLAIFLLHPIVSIYLKHGVRARPGFFMIVAAYVSWLIMFAVHAEYPTYMFAIVYALLAYEVRRAPPNGVSLWMAAAVRRGRGAVRLRAAKPAPQA